MRAVIARVLGLRRLGFGGTSDVPATAILDESGNAILDETGAFILEDA